MAARTVLHIGAMKSATTYLQGTCDANVDALSNAGILWPGSRLCFDAVRDLLGPGPPTEKWRELRQGMARHPGTVLLSNELLSMRAPWAARKLVRRLGTPVEIIITARDLARVVPSQWQTGQEYWGTPPWPEFIQALVTDDYEHRAVRWFWRRQDIARIVDRWAPRAESITLVTVPPHGSALTMISDRFAAALGHTSDLFQKPSLKPPVDRAHPQLTASEHTWVAERSARLVNELKARNLRIVGSLDDLQVPLARG